MRWGRALTMSGCVVLVISSLAMPIRASAASDAPSFIDLGSGATYAINDRGTVVGSHQDSDGVRAAVWSGTVRTDLEELAGGHGSVATAISPHGTIAGYAGTPSGCVHAVVWGPRVADLGALDGCQSTATGINDAGQVVGTVALSGPYTQAMFYDGSRMIDLGVSTARSGAVARGINVAGVVVGEGGDGHAFLYDGALQPLPDLAGGVSAALAVSDSGVIVGYSYLLPGIHRRAVVWRRGAITDLGTLGGDDSVAWAVSSANEVIGVSATGDGASHLFSWTESGGMRDINERVPASVNANQFSPAGVNRSGQIVGTGNIGTVAHAFVLNPPVTISADFSWRMQSRLGDGGPLVYPRVINPVDFGVQFDACGSAGAVLFTWSIGATTLGTSPRCDGFIARLPTGIQSVTLRVSDAAGATASITHAVTVRDYLIVSIGDSIASGEGNPDIDGTCAGVAACTVQPVWRAQYPTGADCGNAVCNQNYRCDRSTLAGPAQAAARFEKAGSGSYSVTFVHLACSGASVAKGLLGSYRGINKVPGAPIAPQVTQLRELLHGRPIDALLLSVGANDIEFAALARDCIAGLDSPNPLDKFNLHCPSADKINKRIARMTDDFGLLAACISSPRCVDTDGNTIDGLGLTDPTRVYITEYPDATHAEDGSFCGHLAAFQEYYERVVGPLNRALEANAGVYHWQYVGGIASEFRAHGVCANDASRWVVSRSESIRREGTENGWIHPNRAGTDVYVRHLLEVLDHTLR